jgi:hypothetical protein
MKLGVIVIFLKYAVTEQINRQQKLLTPIGKPTTTSLTNPARNIEP